MLASQAVVRRFTRLVNGVKELKYKEISRRWLFRRTIVDLYETCKVLERINGVDAERMISLNGVSRTR